MTYSLDLIKRVVNYYKKNNVSLRYTSEIFCVSKSIISVWLNKIPIKYIKNVNKIEINNELLSFVKNSLNQNPFQTQIELRDKLNKKFDRDESVCIIKKILKIIGYSKKKVSRKLYNNDLKKHLNKQKEFVKQVKKIDHNKIISIDEVSVNRNTFNKYGYNKKNNRLEYYTNIKALIKNKSIIVAISNKKVIKYVIYEKSINKDKFKIFIEELVKEVKNKCIIMDNINFHKTEEIKKIIKDSNNEIIYTPPYSPKYNPIEEVFSEFKSYIRKNTSVINNFKNIDKTITDFFKYSGNFEKYFYRSFN